MNRRMPLGRRIAAPMSVCWSAWGSAGTFQVPLNSPMSIRRFAAICSPRKSMRCTALSVPRWSLR
ncbi:hypothetical protein AMK32_35510 [Streptomyces sp. CB01883]|nr:hypothetical protein AMK32_35510 [Streptomyces sp. CB01883]